VLEATILATRIGILPDHEIREAMVALQLPVEKTAGPVEISAWNLVLKIIVESLGEEGLPSCLAAPDAARKTLAPENLTSRAKHQTSNEEPPL
jgi:hypothetical protein